MKQFNNLTIVLIMKKGFSVVEVMLAVALFMIFATGLMGVVLGGMDNNRLAGEQVIASQYASEGLEIARSQGFASLANNNATFDKYSRTVAIAPINTDTKKVVSTVSWNVNSALANSVVLTTYLTDWRAGNPSATCTAYCVGLGSYTTGTCRENTQQCTNHNESYMVGGDPACVTTFPGDPSHDTCCCL